MFTKIFHKTILIAALFLFSTILTANNVDAQKLYRMGPSGGLGGVYFHDSNVPGDSRVSEVRVRHGSWIDAIQIFHVQNNRTIAMNKHGGDGGRFSSFKLGDDDYIKAIGGGYGRFVQSIRIYTNNGSSRTYGSGGKANYYYEAPRGYEIVGFLGRSGAFLDAVGVIVRERRKP
ncbi:MAG: hypothetical protein GY859_07225 [Desulfobacterales bacterium]|nr:hypothetical protein [Desulfobacterales bacterium]